MTATATAVLNVGTNMKALRPGDHIPPSNASPSHLAHPPNIELDTVRSPLSRSLACTYVPNDKIRSLLPRFEIPLSFDSTDSSVSFHTSP